VGQSNCNIRMTQGPSPIQYGAFPNVLNPRCSREFLGWLLFVFCYMTFRSVTWL